MKNKMILTLFALLLTSCASFQKKNTEQFVTFLSPRNGETVDSNFEVKFGNLGFEIVKAGEHVGEKNYGHYHLLINQKPYKKGVAIPTDEFHIHYGNAQTSDTLTLKPGSYFLTLQIADAAHRSLGEEFSETIQVHVKENYWINQKMTYSIGSKKYEGKLLYKKGIQGKKPGILLVHNWMGVTDESVTQAKRFADLGYVVFIADIYGKGVRPKNTNEAAKLATYYKKNRKIYRKHLQKSLAVLKSSPHVDKNNIGAIGYCFGGTGVLELARSGADFQAGVSFHGGLDSPTPSDGKNIKARLQIHHGNDDPFVPKDELKAFREELDQAKVNYEFHGYDGAVHSFTEKAAGFDNKKGAAYNDEADHISFERTKEFFQSRL